jgi:hypothetical protein
MVRPRWHDALIITAIVGVFFVGVWALWWDDVRAFWGDEAGSGSAEGPAPVAPGKV